jgi:hypothetical protein
MEVGRGTKPFTIRNKPVTKYKHEPRTLTDSLDKQHKQWNKDMRLGTWNVFRLYRAGSLVTVLKELSKYGLDLVGVQEVR